MKFLLASQSAGRRKALDILGLDYEAIASDFDERSIRDDNPIQLAIKLSEAKAKTLAATHKGAIIIAADLFVVFKNKIYEKPNSIEEAITMLSTFSGNTLSTISGLAVYEPQSDTLLSDSSVCHVTFRILSEEDIRNYTSRYPVLNFSGAFDGEGMIRFAEHINGNYNFAVGLDVSKLASFIERLQSRP